MCGCVAAALHPYLVCLPVVSTASGQEGTQPTARQGHAEEAEGRAEGAVVRGLRGHIHAQDGGPGLGTRLVESPGAVWRHPGACLDPWRHIRLNPSVIFIYMRAF